MHTLYAYVQNSFDNIQNAEKYLFDSLDSTYNLYLQINYVTSAVLQYSAKEVEVSKQRYLNDEVPVTDQWLGYDYLKLMEEVDFAKIFKKAKLEYLIEEDLIRELYKTFKSSEQFEKILKAAGENKEDQTFAIQYLLADIIMNNEEFDLLMEDRWINWQDEKEFVLNATLKTIKFCDFEKKVGLFAQEYKGWEEDVQFMKKVLKYAFYEEHDLNREIETLTKNWVLERITLIDRMIIHTALSEMHSCNEVPLRVSLNEYIELSKLYSTPKSKDFVNGVLDKAVHKLIENGERSI